MAQWAALIYIDHWFFLSSFSPFWPKYCTLPSVLGSTPSKHKQEIGEASSILEYTRIRGKELGFPPDLPHCTWQACTYISKTGNQCRISHMWGGCILSLQRLTSCTVVQRRTSSPAFPCCNVHPTGKGQHLSENILFSAKLPFTVSSFYSFIRKQVQQLKSQLEKALVDLI